MNHKIIINLFEALIIILFFELAIHYLRPHFAYSFSDKLMYYTLLFICIKSIRLIFERLLN